jgi:ATP-binding cassette subfamily B protein
MGITIGATPTAAVASLSITVAMAATSVLGVWLTKLVVDHLATGADATGVALVYGATLVFAAAADPVKRLLGALVEERAVGEVDRLLIAAGTRLVDLHRVEQPAFQDELEVVGHGIHFIPRSLILLDRAVGVPLTLLGVLALLVRVNPVLPVVLGVVTVAHVVAEQQMSRLKHDALVRRSRAAREMDYCVRTVTDPIAAKEVRAFGIGGFFIDRFRDRAGVALQEVRRARVKGVRTTVALAVAHALVIAGGLVYIAGRAGGGGATAGDVALYLGVVVQAATTSWSLAFDVVYGHETLLNLRVVLPLIDDAQPEIALAAPGAGRAAPTELSEGLEFRHVCFSYPASDRLVLDGLCTQLPAGKVTAIVGDNGAGKSTIVRLITRMYDPVRGELAIDGIPLPEFDLDGWRTRLAAVHQDFARLSLTMGQNVAVGGTGDRAVDRRVRGAVEWAGVDELAGRLPMGLETQLTRRFPGGVELSGGEWQKVALARGAVRQATLVILDEPTAGLDPEAEYRLFLQFHELVAGRTALLVSHRFSTVRMADHIVVLEGGRVSESGTHDHLVAVGGRYAQLYEMQAARYR